MDRLLKCQALILKVASRCNLNCTYCYMYNVGDTTYMHQPKFMSNELVDNILVRVQTHCLKHNLRYFEFIFHGGEPLLAKKSFYIDFVRKANAILLPDTRPRFSLQTNGLLLTEDWCKLLKELDISLGISLDGTPAINNKHRVDHQGNGSYDAIIKGLRIAQHSKYLQYSPNILCVIDVLSDPIEVYEHFKSLSVKKINFLLPYSTYDSPPPEFGNGITDTPYADWLLAIFEKWFDEKPPKPGIRLFEQLIELNLGIDRGFEYFGKRNLEFLVIETDGGIEAVGALKVCGNGFTKAGMNVLRNELDESLDTELARLYHLSHDQLPDLCKQCPIVDKCGGGFLPHRYSKAAGFNNPSVFCLDLMKLITTVQAKLYEILPDISLEEKSERHSFKELKKLLGIRKKQESIQYGTKI